jgi:hypothetical protein
VILFARERWNAPGGRFLVHLLIVIVVIAMGPRLEVGGRIVTGMPGSAIARLPLLNKENHCWNESRRLPKVVALQLSDRTLEPRPRSGLTESATVSDPSDRLATREHAKDPAGLRPHMRSSLN